MFYLTNKAFNGIILRIHYLNHKGLTLPGRNRNFASDVRERVSALFQNWGLFGYKKSNPDNAILPNKTVRSDSGFSYEPGFPNSRQRESFSSNLNVGDWLPTDKRNHLMPNYGRRSLVSDPKGRIQRFAAPIDTLDNMPMKEGVGPFQGEADYGQERKGRKWM